MIKKSSFYSILIAILFFGIGFSLAIYVQGREVEKQIPRLIVGDKLNLINSIATQVENNDGINDFNFLFGALCQQVSYLKEESIALGNSISDDDYPSAAVYSQKTIERYEALSKKLDVDSCNID